MRSLLHDLKKVKTRKDLIVAIPCLTTHFDRLADLMIEAEGVKSIGLSDSPLSDTLREELARVYEIPEGRAIIEQCQTEAFERLQSLGSK